MSTPKVQPLELPARETRVQKGEGQSIVADSSTTSRETFSRLDTLSFFTIRFTAGSDLISQKISLRIRTRRDAASIHGIPSGKTGSFRKDSDSGNKSKRKDARRREGSIDSINCTLIKWNVRHVEYILGNKEENKVLFAISSSIDALSWDGAFLVIFSPFHRHPRS